MSGEQKLSGWRKWTKRAGIFGGGSILALSCVLVAWLVSHPSGQRASKTHAYFRCPCPLILAHQGASGHAPSNTLASFSLAKKMGADVLELDIHETRDGVLVVSHDADVRRWTNGQGKIREQTLSQLRALDAGYRFSKRDAKTGEVGFPYRGKGVKIPTLQEVFSTFPKMRVNVEIKPNSTRVAQKLWEMIEKNRAYDRVLVGSFHVQALRAFRELAKGRVPTSASLREGLRFVLSWRLGLGHRWFGPIDALQFPHFPAIRPNSSTEFSTSPSLIRLAHRHGLQVHAWTVNQKRDMEQLLARGIDGIITKYPDRAMEVLRAHKLRPANIPPNPRFNPSSKPQTERR